MNTKGDKAAASKRKILGKAALISRPAFADLTDDYKEAIINHPSCEQAFKDAAKEVRLSVTGFSCAIVDAFKRLLPELNDNELNVSEGEAEYKPLFDLLTESYADRYECNTGLFILMMTILRKKAGKLYCDTIQERADIFVACDEIKKEMQELLIPIRDKCVLDFYNAADQDEWDEIRDFVKHRKDPRSMGMPGNQNIGTYSAGPANRM